MSGTSNKRHKKKRGKYYSVREGLTVIHTVRVCLRCDKQFVADNNNRICDTCKKSIDFEPVRI